MASTCIGKGEWKCIHGTNNSGVFYSVPPCEWYFLFHEGAWKTTWEMAKSVSIGIDIDKQKVWSQDPQAYYRGTGYLSSANIRLVHSKKFIMVKMSTNTRLGNGRNGYDNSEVLHCALGEITDVFKSKLMQPDHVVQKSFTHINLESAHTLLWLKIT